MVTSTRRAVSFGVTCTPPPLGGAAETATKPAMTAKRPVIPLLQREVLIPVIICSLVGAPAEAMRRRHPQLADASSRGCIIGTSSVVNPAVLRVLVRHQHTTFARERPQAVKVITRRGRDGMI